MTGPPPPDPTPPEGGLREKIRIGPVIICFLIGVALTAAPFWLEDRWQWTGVTPSTLTNVGTSFLLASVLFFAERNFVERVQQGTRKVAAESAVAATADLRQDQASLRMTLDDLQRRVSESTARAGAARRDVIADLSEDVTFDAMTRAFEQVHAVNGFWHGGVVVAADGTPDGLRVTVAWTEHSLDAWRYAGEKALTFDVETPSQSGGSPRRCGFRWQPEVDAETFGRGLIEAMISAGMGGEATALDIGELIGQVQLALDLAVASQQHSEGGWLHGPLAILLGPWAVTQAGLEHREEGLVLASNAFPERGFNVFSGEAEPLPRPRWCEQGEWDVVYAAARTLHPPGPVAARAAVAEKTWPVRPRTEEPRA